MAIIIQSTTIVMATIIQSNTIIMSMIIQSTTIIMAIMVTTLVTWPQCKQVQPLLAAIGYADMIPRISSLILIRIQAPVFNRAVCILYNLQRRYNNINSYKYVWQRLGETWHTWEWTVRHHYSPLLLYCLVQCYVSPSTQKYYIKMIITTIKPKHTTINYQNIHQCHIAKLQPWARKSVCGNSRAI